MSQNRGLLEVANGGKYPIVDIVAIHGLDGHRTKTWTVKSERRTMWLRDLLPRELPDSRIFVYGYDANTHGNSTLRIREHGRSLLQDLSRCRSDVEKRPIIFIAHSTGGLVLKRALIASMEDSVQRPDRHNSASKGHLAKILESTCGILFFGTPHAGANGAATGNFILQLCSLFASTNNRIIRQLYKNSELLDDLRDHFEHIHHRFETVCFFESRPTKIFGLIVPQSSAIIEDHVSKAIAIDTNHVDMVKYENEETDDYKKVLFHIKRMVDNLPKHAKHGAVIAVMGATGSGKSSFINLASGSTFKTSGRLESCTTTVEPTQPFRCYGTTVTLIDTPGFDDTYLSDAKILQNISTYLENMYRTESPLHGVIYLHSITEDRIRGHSKENFTMFKALCGSAMTNVVIVTTKWDTGDEAAFEARETQLKETEEFFKQFIDEGAQMYRHYNTRSTASAVLRLILRNRPAALQIQRELVDGKQDLQSTSAGVELNRQAMKQIGIQREEAERLRREILEERNAAMKERLELRYRSLSTDLDTYQRSINQMSLNYVAAKKQFDEATRNLSKHHLEDVKKLRRDGDIHKEELENLKKELQGMLVNPNGIARRRMDEIGEQLRGLKRKQE